MSEITEQTGDLADGGPDADDLFVGDAASSREMVAKRLRQAVRAAGGNAEVSARSGVKTRTLSHYLKGREIRVGVLVALARACGVSLEWLATGDGPGPSAGMAERQAAAPAAPAATPSAPDAAQATPNAIAPSALGIYEWLKSTIHEAGGALQSAMLSDIPIESIGLALTDRPVPLPHLHALLFNLPLPGQSPLAAGDQYAAPVESVASVWDGLDFETLVMCFELQEALDKLGGGQLKSARSRLKRALNAYDLKKNDQE